MCDRNISFDLMIFNIIKILSNLAKDNFLPPTSTIPDTHLEGHPVGRKLQGRCRGLPRARIFEIQPALDASLRAARGHPGVALRRVGAVCTRGKVTQGRAAALKAIGKSARNIRETEPWRTNEKRLREF